MKNVHPLPHVVGVHTFHSGQAPAACRCAARAGGLRTRLRVSPSVRKGGVKQWSECRLSHELVSGEVCDGSSRHMMRAPLLSFLRFLHDALGPCASAQCAPNT